MCLLLRWPFTGLETEQSANRGEWGAQDCRLWLGQGIRRGGKQNDMSGHHEVSGLRALGEEIHYEPWTQMVSASRIAMGSQILLNRRRHMVNGHHLCRAHPSCPIPRWRDRHGSAQEDLPRHGIAHGARMAGPCFNLGFIV